MRASGALRAPVITRPRAQDGSERLAPLPGGLHRDAQALDGGALTHVFVETLRPELALHLRLLGQGDAAHDAGLVGHGRTPPR